MGSDPASAAPRAMLPLWFGVLGPPVIWALRFGTVYGLVPYACWWDWLPVIHVVTVVSLALTALAGWMAWSRGRRLGSAPGADPARAGDRARFMARLGTWSAALFAVVMLAEWVPTFLLSPCQTAGAPIP